VQFEDPQEADLLTFFQTMEKYNNKKILVHCAANMRVTAFLGLYHLIKQGKDEAEAFEPMSTIWDPDDIWASFIARLITKYKKIQ